MLTPEEAEAYKRAANRLHHLSMRYVGALHEAASGRPTGLLPQGHPGLREMRDLIDLVLYTRAEIDALTKLLVDAKVFTTEQFSRQVTEEYEWFAQEKAKMLGVTVTDFGITITRPEN